MTNALAYGGVSKKTLAVIAITVGVLFITMLGVRYAGAVAPSDYGLKEGQTISAVGSNDPDVYIVNAWGYKRLFISPAIFNMYGQLTGGFAAVNSVTPAVRDAFGTSNLFTDCQVGSANNNGKVYALEVTSQGGFGGLAGVGNLHWVNVTGAQAVAQDPNFFQKVFCINDKEFGSYPQTAAYTALSQVPVYSRAGVVAGTTPTPTPVMGAITVSLSPSNPSAATLTSGATGVTFLKIHFVGTGTLSSLRVTRAGAGKSADFGNIYLYDGATRLTSGRTPSSSDGSITFSSLNWTPISSGDDLSIVGDLSSATAGDVHYFTVGATDIVLASGTVGGSFPLSGNTFTVSGQTGGSLTIDKSGSLTNPNVGQSQAEVAEFKLTANTEGSRIYRVTLLNSGSIATSALTNFKLTANGTQVATGTYTSAGYAVFDLSASPYYITRGNNAIFRVFADIAGKKGDTINLYVEVTADVLGVGDQYGYGTTISNGTYTVGSSSTGPTSLTLQGGVLTISFVGPSATNVSTSTTKTHFLDFNLTAASNVDIRKTAVVLCRSMNGLTTFQTPQTASATAGMGDINNVSIVNRDTGSTLIGPSDGTGFTTISSSLTGGASDTPCGSTTGLAKTFTDTVSMTAGQTLHLAIVGDIRTSNATTNNHLKSGDLIGATLYNWGNLVGTGGDVSVLRYTNSTTGPASTDIVPTADVAGSQMTLQGSTLTLGLAATPTSGNHNFVKGATGVNALGLNLIAALGNPVTLTSLTVTGYGGSSSSVTAGTGVGSLVSALRLIDGNTGAVVAASPTTNNLATAASGKVTFSNLSYVIPGGATNTLMVQTDLAATVPGTNKVFSFDVGATTDVTALDMNSNSINAANSGVNGTTTATTYVTDVASGSLALAIAPDTPVSAPVYWGQSGAPLAKYKFTSTNEAWFLQTLTLGHRTAANRTVLANNLQNMTLTYTNKAGQTLTATSALSGSATTSFSFCATCGAGGSDNQPYVLKDGTTYISVSGNVLTSASLFRAEGSGNGSATYTPIAVNLMGSFAGNFRAVGEGSGYALVGAANSGSSTVADVTGSNNMYPYRAYPQFAFVPLSAPLPTIAAGNDIFKFTVQAYGNQNDGSVVFFNGGTTAASGTLKFAVLASGESASTLGLDLRQEVDSTGAASNLLLNSQNVSNAIPAVASSASFQIGAGTGGNTVQIPAGKTATFAVRLNGSTTGYAKTASTNTGRAADYIQVILKTVEANNVQWVDNGGPDRISSPTQVANTLQSLPLTGQRITFY